MFEQVAEALFCPIPSEGMLQLMKSSYDVPNRALIERFRALPREKALVMLPKRSASVDCYLLEKRRNDVRRARAGRQGASVTDLVSRRFS